MFLSQFSWSSLRNNPKNSTAVPEGYPGISGGVHLIIYFKTFLTISIEVLNFSYNSYWLSLRGKHGIANIVAAVLPRMNICAARSNNIFQSKFFSELQQEFFRGISFRSFRKIHLQTSSQNFHS